MYVNYFEHSIYYIKLSDGDIKGFSVGKGDVSINHLQFADDTILLTTFLNRATSSKPPKGGFLFENLSGLET